MLQPKRTKYRKVQKGRMKGNAQRGHELSNGMFGIKSVHEDGMFLLLVKSKLHVSLQLVI
jgi:large subunit ribosomal protein L16